MGVDSTRLTGLLSHPPGQAIGPVFFDIQRAPGGHHVGAADPDRTGDLEVSTQALYPSELQPHKHPAHAESLISQTLHRTAMAARIAMSKPAQLPF